MRRVLHVINGDLYAGAERVQDHLALQLPAFGYECGFVALKDGAFAANRLSTGTPLEVIPMRSRIDMRGVSAIRQRIRAGIEIVHTHTTRTALVGGLAARLAGVPWVHHVHSPTERDTESAVRNAVNGMVEKFLILKRADRLVAVSRSLEDYLVSHGSAKQRIVVIPNGVPSASTPRAWAPPTSDWVVGTTAFFRPRKGLDVLLRAVALLKARNAPVRLRVVGGFELESYHAEMRQLAEQLGIAAAVDWTGFTRNVGAEFSRMDLFVLPSLFGEGSPMVIIEAMAASLPIVASDVEGIADQLGGGSAGVVVPPNDPAALAEAIGALVAQPDRARQLAVAADARQREHYSDVSMARMVSDVYRSLGH